MLTAQRPTIRERAERISNVALSLPWCQPRLGRSRTRPCKKIRAHRKVPEVCETLGEHFALVVSTLAPARRREWHRNERRPLALDVGWKAQRRHPACHRRAERVPPVVLEGVHDRLRRAAGHGVHRPYRAHERRQQRTPRAGRRRTREVGGMSTPIAARTWQLSSTQPARAADELALVGGARTSADGAGRGQEQVEQRARRAPPGPR